MHLAEKILPPQPLTFRGDYRNPHFREAVSHYRTERTRSGGMNWHRSRDR